MDNQFPPEAEDLGWLSGGLPRKGVVEGVNDASAKLIEGFQFDWYELEVLARHYLWEVRDSEYFWVAYKTTASAWLRKKEFALARLDSIERILGEDVLAKALAPVEEKWRRRFDELKVDLATPVKCEKCGEEFYREVLYQVTCVGCPPVDGSLGLEGLPF